MMARLKVLSGMLIFRRIAASNMAAGKTHSQMNPGITCLQTLFAAIRAWRDVPSLIEMCTCHQKIPLSIRSSDFTCASESTIGQISVHKGHRHRTFTDGRCTSLYRSVPHVSGREHSGHTCLQIERLPFQWPAFGAHPVTQ
jgi:hypothetical protein